MAMSRMQYMLVKLAEEASELAQIALKTAEFGPLERYKDGPTNIDRVDAEFNDVMTIIALINAEMVKLDPKFDNFLHIKTQRNFQKIIKVEHYYNYSKSLGMVE